MSSRGVDASRDAGPPSLPFTAEEEDGDVRNRQRQLIQQLQEALDEKKSAHKQPNGARRTHRSSGDLAPQRQELTWRSKVRGQRKFGNRQQVRPSVRRFQFQNQRA